MNKRRELLAALGAGALTATFCSFAQQQRINRIGVLSATFKSNPLTQAFVQELRALGYTEGQNLLIVDRVADGNLQRLPAFAAELVAERVDVIFADSTNAARAARQATASIPIVFSTVSDPVGSGFLRAGELDVMRHWTPRRIRRAIAVIGQRTFTNNRPAKSLVNDSTIRCMDIAVLCDMYVGKREVKQW